MASGSKRKIFARVAGFPLVRSEGGRSIEYESKLLDIYLRRGRGILKPDRTCWHFVWRVRLTNHDELYRDAHDFHNLRTAHAALENELLKVRKALTRVSPRSSP